MNLKESISRPVNTFGYALVILLLVFFFLPAKNMLMVDEHVHYWQIISFLTGDFKMNDKLTTLPGYHLMFALFGVIFHNGSVVFFRIISIFFASLTILMFSVVDNSVNGRTDYGKILFFTFLPILFPYYFLIYTDVFSMLLFLCSLYLGLKKHYQISAVLGILNMVVRQNTFFWFIFTFFLLFITHYPIINFQNLINYLKKSWAFAFGVILFILFIFLNHGIAIGDKEMHPGATFHLSNVFFFMAITGVFIFPLKLEYIKFNYFKLHHYLIIIITFVLYWFCFEATHPYNFLGDGFFLRNEFLSFILQNEITKGLFFIPILAALLLFFRLYQDNPRVFSLYFLFGTLSLIPSWLIEQRYYFIHLIILVIYGYREGFSKYSIVILLIYFMSSLFLVYGIFTNSFFL